MKRTIEIQKENQAKGHLSWGVAGWVQAFELEDRLDEAIEKLRYWVDTDICDCFNLDKGEKCLHCDTKEYLNSVSEDK